MLGGGIAGGLLGSLIGSSGQKNPSDAAMPYLNQIPDISKQYYQPFIDRSNSAYNNLNPQYLNMMHNPSNFLDNLISNYEPSRSYQLRKDEMERSAGNTAAAGGMRGSLFDITNQSRIRDALLGEDMQSWLSNVLGIQKMGQQGQQNFYDTGFQAAHGLSSDIANALATQASLEFQGQRERNKSDSDSGLGLGKLIGAGAGFMMGGPAGSLLGSSFF